MHQKPERKERNTTVENHTKPHQQWKERLPIHEEQSEPEQTKAPKEQTLTTSAQKTDEASQQSKNHQKKTKN